MDVKQIYTLMNSVSNEILGKTDIIQEDLSGVGDMGTEIFNANAVDKYVKSLVNHIGKVIFVNRPYSGNIPSVLMDGWEFGSVLEKIQAEIPNATENESWELEDGQSYDPNVFYKPVVSAKFYNSKVTFEVPVSITERQVKQSFSSATQLNGFLSMVYDAVDKSMTIKIDSLVMRVINNMIADTVYEEYDKSSAAHSSKSGIRAVNLLKLYNDTLPSGTTALTYAQAMVSPDFLRFAAYTMGLYKNRMSRISTLYNIGGKNRFTPADQLHVVLLNDFVAGASAYLQSDTFHKELVALPKAETVPYWQAPGQSYALADISEVKIKTFDNHTMDVNGVMGVMFDRNALGVCNQDRRVTTNYNPKAEFYNNYYKFDASYFNDTNENFVVFFAE